MAKEIVRVLRVLEYTGERDWVEATISQSIQGTKLLTFSNKIKAATIGDFPEVIGQFDDDMSFLDGSEFYDVMARFRDAVTKNSLEDSGIALENIKTFIKKRGKE